METWFTDNAIYFLAAAGCILNFFWLRSFRGILKFPASLTAALSLVYAALDYLFVKVFAVIEYLDLSAFSKMSLFGAIFFMPFALWGIAKVSGIKPALLLDISTPGLLCFLMCGRINCLITGCCYGTEFNENFRWPVREAEIAFYLVLIIIFGIRLKKGKAAGRYYAVFLAAYGVFRFLAEFVRYFPDQDGLWHRGHIFAVISLIAGIIWLVSGRRAESKENGTIKVLHMPE